MRSVAVSRSLAIGALAALLLGNAVLALGVVEPRFRISLSLALVPALLLGLGALVASNRAILVFAALALPVSQHRLNEAYPLPGGIMVFASDLIVMLAVGAWFVARLMGGTASRTRSPVLGWPFALFGTLMIIAVFRGHAYYGEGLFSEATRIVAYAAIGLAMTDLTARQAYRGITVVFYIAAVWMLLNAVYLMATGGSQTNASDLSTGGTRVLSGTVSTYVAASLILALLNLGIHRAARRRVLDFSIVLFASSAVILGYFRAVFLACALVMPFILFRPRISRPLFQVLPLFLPVLLAAAVFVPMAAPNLVPELIHRVSAPATKDPNVQWREQANAAVWQQVKQSPVIGVGFGKIAYFELMVPNQEGIVLPQRTDAGQDPHDSFMLLAAGGGFVTLAAYLLLLATFAHDTLRRVRFARSDEERIVATWAGLSAFVFVVTSASGPVLSNAPQLIGFWVLLLLPSAVVPLDRDAPLTNKAVHPAAGRSRSRAADLGLSPRRSSRPAAT